jgi:hypothetical protein
MLRSKIINIPYARISTGNTDQLSSLGNQCKLLKDYCKLNAIVNCNSGKDEFPDELKNAILNETAKNNDVRIIVTSFDRLTRNFRDLHFIQYNVKYIHVLDENKEYNVKNQLYELSQKVAGCALIIQEKSDKGIKVARLKKLSGVKRERDDENEKEIDIEFNLRRRCKLVANNLCEDGIPRNIVDDLVKLIDISQNLDSLEKWNSMFNLLKKLDFNPTTTKKNYEKYLNEYKNKNKDNNQIYRLEKSEINNIIHSILKKKNLIHNNVFVKQFIDSNIRHSNFDPVDSKA